MGSALVRNLPNLVSFIRILMAPVLLYLAIKQLPGLFLAAVVFTTFTDVLDGFLARLLNQITELGARLDSWGDFAVYSCLAISAWILWPDLVRQELIYALVIIASFTLPVLVRTDQVQNHHQLSYLECKNSRGFYRNRLSFTVFRAYSMAVPSGSFLLYLCGNRANNDHHGDATGKSGGYQNFLAGY